MEFCGCECTCSRSLGGSIRTLALELQMVVCAQNLGESIGTLGPGVADGCELPAEGARTELSKHS